MPIHDNEHLAAGSIICIDRYPGDIVQAGEFGVPVYSVFPIPEDNQIRIEGKTAAVNPPVMSFDGQHIFSLT